MRYLSDSMEHLGMVVVIYTHIQLCRALADRLKMQAPALPVEFRELAQVISQAFHGEIRRLDTV
ncbi:MAG: hypothetical protein U5L98_17180 [Halomonas sp.]|uniref:hypothetical protein n=1 Tax=Halomonas sp. TaxID=1486246 RepID=UPI002ACF029C|nr:hypothetical protein [Halomonas sp.]MDZ7854308.1 hypothetical protein [Halomonas sp.]